MSTSSLQLHTVKAFNGLTIALYFTEKTIVKPCSHISAMASDEGFATSATGLRYMRTLMNYIGDGRRPSAIKSQKTK